MGLYKMKPIGIDIPIRRGTNGFFSPTYTTQDAIKVNLKNLLLTSFGERPMNPSFGNNFKRLLFEGELEETKIQIRESVLSTIQDKLPSVRVEDFIFENISDDYTISFSIIFSILPYPNLIDRLTLEVKAGN